MLPPISPSSSAPYASGATSASEQAAASLPVTEQRLNEAGQSTASTNSKSTALKRPPSPSPLQLRFVKQAKPLPSTTHTPESAITGTVGPHPDMPGDEPASAEMGVFFLPSLTVEQQTHALREALSRYQAEEVRTLLQTFKGDLDTLHETTGVACPPVLHLIAFKGDIATLKLLVDSEKIKKFDTREYQNGTTALMAAVFNGGPEVVELLAEKMQETNPQAINMKSRHGQTALRIAAESHNYEITRILIEKGADLATPYQDGKKLPEIVAKAWRDISMNQPGTAAETLALLTTLTLIKLRPEEKFNFSYETSTSEKRMLEEDQFSLHTLHSATSRKAILEMGKSCAAYIKDHANDNGDLIPGLNTLMKEHRGSYPTLKEDFKDLPDLLSFFEKHTAEDNDDKNGHVKLLSVLWCLPKHLPSSEQVQKERTERDAIYRNIMEPTKDYIKISPTPPKPSRQFGNTGKIQDDAFSDRDFSPFSRSNEYISVNNKSSSYQVRNYIKKQKPYVSGLSGMMNMTTALLDTLKMHPLEKETGKPFCEAMAAFIVGSGMHSYPEVYKALNLHLKLLKARELRQDGVVAQNEIEPK